MITQEEINRNYVDSIEAGRLLDITDSRIRRLCLDGRFEGALKTGKSWIIPRKSVENFIRRHPGKPPKEIPGYIVLSNAIKEANKWKENEHLDE